jgi:hypothetical protein
MWARNYRYIKNWFGSTWHSNMVSDSREWYQSNLAIELLRTRIFWQRTWQNSVLLDIYDSTEVYEQPAKWFTVSCSFWVTSFWTLLTCPSSMFTNPFLKRKQPAIGKTRRESRDTLCNNFLAICYPIPKILVGGGGGVPFSTIFLHISL